MIGLARIEVAANERKNSSPCFSRHKASAAAIEAIDPFSAIRTTTAFPSAPIANGLKDRQLGRNFALCEFSVHGVPLSEYSMRPRPAKAKRTLQTPLSLYGMTLDQIMDRIRRFKPEKKTPAPKKRKRKRDTNSTRR
jgi:hypothetical protein